MRTFYFVIAILLNNIFISQESKIIDPPVLLNEMGLRLEIKNFFIYGHRFKIQEIKPFYKLNEKFKIGFGYCSLRDKNFYFQDSTLLRINSSNFFGSYNWIISEIISAEATLDFGIGRIKSVNIDDSIDKGAYSFFEPAIIINHNGFNFFNLGFGSGIRFTRNDKSIFYQNLTLPTLILRFSLKFTEIYNHFHHRANTSLYLSYD